MKNLSLKMDDIVFNETEKITAKIKKNHNRYINEGVQFYNLLQKRRIISGQLQKESRIVQEESMKVLAEFEKLQVKIKQYEIWITDLNPGFGIETGKPRPVVIIQTNLLNKFHPSTIVCPITTNMKLEADILRVHLTKGYAKLNEDCDIMIDQIRAIIINDY